MRISPRLLVLLPAACVLLVVGQMESHKSYAQNPVAAPDPLRDLPSAPLQNGVGTLGGPRGTVAVATPRPTQPPPRPAKPAPTSVQTPVPIPSNAIRVGLSTKGGPLQLWLPGGAVLRDLEQPARLQTLAANTSILLVAGAVKSEKVGARTFSGPISVQSDSKTLRGWNKIQIAPLGSTFPRATSNGASPRYGRPYRGSFEVFLQRSPEPNHRKGALALINVVGLEDYLKGVVPWEMSPNAPSEALKAQAICARTKTIDFKMSKRFAPGGFDVCDYDACQGYPGTENEKPATTQAVQATKGIALFHGGRPIDAVYSTNSGGVTAAARDVWRSDVPYLQSVRDFSTSSPLENLFSGSMNEGKWAQFVSQPFPSFARPDGVAQTRYEARKYRWTQFVSVEEATKAFAAQGLARVTNIEVETRASSGRARRIKQVGVGAAQLKTTPTPRPESSPRLDGSGVLPSVIPTKTVVLEGDGSVRSMFSKQLGSTTALPSSLFVVSPQTDASGQITGWNFSGAGWGHGVGMCQRGAQNHALAGWDARRILSHYYRGVEIRQTTS